MMRLPSFAEILIKLRPDDMMRINHVGPPTIVVNDMAIYHVPDYEKDYSPFRLKRSVRGTLLLVPSLYRQTYHFENGGYVLRTKK